LDPSVPLGGACAGCRAHIEAEYERHSPSPVPHSDPVGQHTVTKPSPLGRGETPGFRGSAR
jgi:hypothetical protein